ncbi:hypothetical protein [Coralliovum pocilloporae]|uniref:hypothetical protein n=1 Tax=Coralliovum pocilloporae TaxID=3066369 RepID=UPI003307361F
MLQENREALGMLILRLGLAWFIFVWAVNKFLAPQQYANIWKHFHGIDIGSLASYGFGTIQIIICLMVFLGWKRLWSYGALALMHGVTIAVIFPRLIDPFEISERGFPVNRNSSIALAVFLAMLALWLLRHRDVWSLDEWLKAKARD